MSTRAAPGRGLRLEAHKLRPLLQPLRVLPAPGTAVLALDQGSGEAAACLVRPGERVRLGTRVARGGSASADLHSPVSGVVREISQRSTPAGQGRCIVIDNDFEDAPEPSPPPSDWRTLDGPQLIERLRAGGVAGLGGAAFPCAAKLELARAMAVRHLVLNGAECEPWICCDDALMRARAADVVLGARIMLAACGAERCTIAVEDDKPEAATALAAALAAAADARLSLLVLPAVYPLGAERQLIAAVTGAEVPHDALPPHVGVVCQNVGTAAAAARCITDGTPATSRVVTITGSAVQSPANVEARLGTPVAELIAACGGCGATPLRLIAGGSLTGHALPDDTVPVTKGLNCVIAATPADVVARGPEQPCIRCGDCATVCPANLLPQQLHFAIRADDAAGQTRYGLADCIECGCCDYVCPSQIPLTARFRAARARLDLQATERRRASEAKARFERHERRLAEQAQAERRAFEEARDRARSAARDDG